MITYHKSMITSHISHITYQSNQINEVGSLQQQLSTKTYRMQINIEGSEQMEESFFFQPIPNKILQDKEAKEILTKWGLFQTLRIGSFRYNQHFSEYESSRFMVDLLNNPNVRYILNNIKLKQEAVGSVECEKMRCHELTLQIFDELEKEQIVKKGYISKMMSEYYEEIEICDKVRECLLMEESQHYCVFNETQRKEFLLKLFQLLLVGGSFNQYEDVIQPYLDWTKKIYKSLVSVRKRSQTNQLFIESIFYDIKSIDAGKTYKRGYHPQNVLYVLINPSIRTVHVIANQWKKFW